MITASKRTLLVSPVPPCDTRSDGLFLKELCERALFPAGLFIVRGADAAVRPDPALSVRAPVQVIEDPHGLVAREVAAPFIRETREKVLRFARQIGATDIWLVLEGPTLIRLAESLLEQIDIPVRVQVLAPPAWWLRVHAAAPETARDVLASFDAVMRNAGACAAASWAMAAKYQALYGIAATALVPALDGALARPPAARPGANSLRVGFAGVPYAVSEFQSLLVAMTELAQENPTLQVELHLFCPEAEGIAGHDVLKPRRGLEAGHLIQALSELDVLYCPSWFSEAMREEADLSFPLKLAAYLAAGRPVLFHGRADSGPGRFLRRDEAAFFCFRPDTDALKHALLRALARPEVYERMACNGRALFDRFLSADALKTAFDTFMAPPAPGEMRADQADLTAC